MGGNTGNNEKEKPTEECLIGAGVGIILLGIVGYFYFTLEFSQRNFAVFVTGIGVLAYVIYIFLYGTKICSVGLERSVFFHLMGAFFLLALIVFETKGSSDNSCALLECHSNAVDTFLYTVGGAVIGGLIANTQKIIELISQNVPYKTLKDVVEILSGHQEKKQESSTQQEKSSKENKKE